MELHKGYLKTKDKKCVTKFEDCVTYEEIRHLSEYAGLLAEGVTLVDVDDEEQADALYDIVVQKNIECVVYQTTRGKHFLFKTRDPEAKNATGAKTPIGITVDIKHGHRNSYQILKADGKMRKILKDTDEPDEVPVWLTPIKTTTGLWNLEEGKRNDTLYSYILTLQRAGFEKQEIRETFFIINDFILNHPVSKEELETILRNEAFSKNVFFKNKQFRFDEFAKFLKSEYSIKRVNGSMCFYDDGVYVYDTSAIERKMIKHIPTLKKTQRLEVMSYLHLIAPPAEAYMYENMIAFKNGLYDLESGELKDFSPEYIVTNKIPWDYNPSTYNESVDRVLNNISCHDPEIRNLLEEMVGYSMYRRSSLGKAFILVGRADNGKSTLLDMLIQMLGQENVSALDLNELHARFKTAVLLGKLANIGDDIGGKYIEETQIFKKLVTGNPVNVEHKGGDPFDFTNYASLIFSANSLPRLGKGVDNDAIVKRLVLVPLKARFTKDSPDYDPDIKYKIRTQEAMEYLIQLGIRGLKRALSNKGFTQTEETVEQLHEYEKTNNPILGFIDEIGDENIVDKKPAIVYDNYKMFCEDNGLHRLSGIEFGRQICSILGLKSKAIWKDGKTIRVYAKEES